MKYIKTLFFSSLAVLAIGCEDKEKAKEDLFAINSELINAQYKPEESINLEVLNKKGKEIDSIVYYINDKNVGTVRGAQKLTVSLKDQKFGSQNIKALVFYEGENAEATESIEVISDVTPVAYSYTVVNTYPHDMTTFTQGLEFYRDTLIESSGQNGNSYFRKLDYKTGKVYKQVDLSQQYFGEGITVFDNKIYQLTWREKTGFIYNADTGKLIKSFPYDREVEGWGLANDGKTIYKSDGTEKIWTMDPETQKLTDYVNVYSSSNKIKSINELEYIDGKIYGNIWQRDAIAIIDPSTGAVEGVLNLAELRKELKSPTQEVLNGIAYNPKTKTIFVTGKNWDKMFEIKVSK
ncbi:MAG: glutaminyl-peptide cyclotransferase [Flavobacterium sp.]|nr:glutaminyl-peptide cyclotransferase [Flavobacterium sp.]